MNLIEVEFIRLYGDASPMRNAYGDDAGWDLTVHEDTMVKPWTGVDVKSGIAVAIPTGFYGRIVGRSSTLRKKGLLVIEGIIDAGFRGELFSYAFNPSGEEKYLSAGESIAQLIIQPVPRVNWRETLVLPYSERGKKGFGSSGN